jgi:uncharacterized membrane protein
MSAAFLHVLVVHLPVIGVLFTLAVLTVGAVANDRRIILMGWVFLVVCAVGAAVAYGSGPPAFESLKNGLDDPTRELAEQHAVIGRAAFILMVLAGIIALQGLLRTASAEQPSRWLVRGLIALLLVAAVLLGWTAHLGGGIRHPEARSATSPGDASPPG